MRVSHQRHPPPYVCPEGPGPGRGYAGLLASQTRPLKVWSQTFTNRSFWTAATASGLVVNQPVSNWLAGNTAEMLGSHLADR